MLRKWGLFFLIVFWLPVGAFAQSTGKIVGQVTDASTGDVLPGASVVLVGTTLGSAADVDGNYLIIGVPIGTYSVQAQFVGFQAQTTVGVEVNAGYTRELNFALQPGVELEELVIEYERPLIQKDAVGVPKILDAEEIVTLPVRGASSVARIQAGVVSREGSGTLNIRGGRGGEVTYYVDGVKNGYAVPQGAVQQQEMLIGSINARYGDAMSGIINITTKSGASNFFGSLEALSSTQFDSYGYNLISASAGGPIIGDKLSFFAVAEYTTTADRDPRSTQTPHLSDAQIDDLWSAPSGIRFEDPSGEEFLVGLPIELEDGAKLRVGIDGKPDLRGGRLAFSDGTMIPVPEGSKIVSFTPTLRALELSDDDFTYGFKKRMRSSESYNFNANITWNALENARVRVGGIYGNYTGDGPYWPREIFSPYSIGAYDNHAYSAFINWTQYLSTSTFYEVQASWRSYFREEYDPRFPRPSTGNLDILWSYADLDHPVHATLAGRKYVTYTRELVVDDNGTPDDPLDDISATVRVPSYKRSHEDGIGDLSESTAGLVGAIGGGFNNYGKSHGHTYRIAASTTTQLGLSQLEFGGEYETSVGRSWGFSEWRAARIFADGDPENIDPEDKSLNPAGYTSFEDVPLHILRDIMGGPGYNILGDRQHDSENFVGFQNTEKNKPEVDYFQAPHRPIYYGGFVQNKIEFRDIVLNLGVRVDVWDNNRPVLKDKYARRPIERARDLSINLPSGIGGDYAVYFSGNNVVGYRDLRGHFYDANGTPAGPNDILLTGIVRRKGENVTEDMFEDYKPQITVMPRIGVSFPITDQSLFFASYGIVSKRPSEGAALLSCISAISCRWNNSLLPENTTKYELGFRQRLGVRQALTISGFFHQINNLIQLRNIRGASPESYTRFENVDYGTVKGLEFDYDLRRTQGVALRANYTLSFAQGTGSGSYSTGTIVWINETPPNFISPLDFDQRHKLNVTLDYSLGKGEGPTLVGTKLLQNFGFNVLFTAGSGFPYTGIQSPTIVTAARATRPRGGVNAERLPWTNRIDLRIQRRFSVGGTGTITAFLWMQNALNTVNIQGAYRYTGLPNDDGFLSTSGGVQYLESNPNVTETLYRFRNRGLGNYGRPRLTRLGIRFDF